MRALRLSACFLTLAVVDARANVPVEDSAQLTEKSQTRSDTDKMVPVQQDQNKKQKGINCATHTGQQGNARDTTASPNQSAGAQAVKQYNPDATTAPAPGAAGPQLAAQTTESSAAKVVAGNMATQTTVTTTGPVYQQASAYAGQSATIMAGYDANSSGGVQNGMSWNQVMATANLWVEAYNAINVARVSGFSQGAQAMRFIPWAVAIAPANSACGVGYRGNGSAADPCVATSSAVCQSLSDGGCWERRYVDGAGNVVIFLESISASTQSLSPQ
jgi:hypothetical protein